MRRSRRELLGTSATALTALVAGCSGWNDGLPGGRSNSTKVDDWQFDPSDLHGGGGNSGWTNPFGGGNPSNHGTGHATATQVASAPRSRGSKEVGATAGGAKSIATFRKNVEEGYLPLPSSLSYEGLFYDYYFDTGGGSCTATFCPAYSGATAPDPLSGTDEQYLRVGLDSGLSSVDRKPLNLVVVLDVSGSMGEEFDEYYYDRHGNKKAADATSSRPKIDVATDVIASMTTNFRPDDRFGMVVFNDEAAVAKPVRKVGETDMAAIREHVRELEAGGGTNISAGIETATELLAPYDDQDRTVRETRSIVVTDAMPNVGTTDDSALLETLEDNAAAHHYTTFVGVGVDFNTAIVDAITAVEGANYYPIHSAKEFKRKLDDEFKYMVTPIAFDLSVTLDAADHGIATVYGTTAAEDATAEVLGANTIFPSPQRKGRSKGGVILVQLAGTGSGDVTLEATWETRDGQKHRTTADATLPAEGFDGSAIRKATLLTRYADLLKNWMIYERRPGLVDPTGGISVPPDLESDDDWEQQSEELVVSEPYRQRIDSFTAHFEEEKTALGDDRLEQELKILRTLQEYGS